MKSYYYTLFKLLNKDDLKICFIPKLPEESPLGSYKSKDVLNSFAAPMAASAPKKMFIKSIN